MFRVFKRKNSGTYTCTVGAVIFSIVSTLLLIVGFYAATFYVVSEFSDRLATNRNLPNKFSRLETWEMVIFIYLPQAAAYTSAFALTKKVFSRSNHFATFIAMALLLFLNACFMFFLFGMGIPAQSLIITIILSTVTLVILVFMLPKTRTPKFDSEK